MIATTPVNTTPTILQQSPNDDVLAQTPPSIPFFVKGRNRAQKLAEILYGPFARVWKNRGEFAIVIGTEIGQEKKELCGGATYTEALHLPVEQYIKGGVSYKDTQERIRKMAQHATVFNFALEALQQWPEYHEEVKKRKEENSLKNRLEKMVARAGKGEVPQFLQQQTEVASVIESRA